MKLGDLLDCFCERRLFADAQAVTNAHADQGCRCSYSANWCGVRYAELLRDGLDADNLAALTADGAGLSEGRALEEAFAV